MADLFLSYTHQDTNRAETLARLLEDAGLTVWWDRQMVAGDKIHDVVDEQIEKAKAVIVLWSPISVKSDWVRGEAQTAHELAKLVPIKIEECKLPVNYRGIHTPEVYKSKAELDKLAKMLSDKFKTAQPLPQGATAEPPAAAKIEFTDKSSADFLMKLKAQKAAYEEESAIAGGLWTDEIDLRLIKKYPLGAAGSGLSNLLKVIIIILLAFPPAEFLDQMFDPVISAVFYSILVGLGFCIYTSFNRATNEKWVTAAERNIGYLLSLLLLNMIMHAGKTAFSIGVKSFTFATFIIVALVVLIIFHRNDYVFPRRGFGS
jgi:TIR domain-containing protein